MRILLGIRNVIVMLFKSAFKHIIHFIYWLLKNILEAATYRMELFRFEIAKRKAVRLNKIDGKRYYVVKLRSQYRVYNSLDVKELKRQKIFKRNMTYYEFSQYCAFTTT